MDGGRESKKTRLLTSGSRLPAGVHLWSESVVHDGPVDLMVSPEAGDRIKDQLTRSGASFTVNINDVQVSSGGAGEGVRRPRPDEKFPAPDPPHVRPITDCHNTL